MSWNPFIWNTVVSLIPCTLAVENMWIWEEFWHRCNKLWFYQRINLIHYEGIYSLPSQKLQHRQVPASLFCRSLNNVHKGCILVNKLLHRQCSFLPACIEKETASVRRNMPCLPTLLSFWFLVLPSLLFNFTEEFNESTQMTFSWRR